MINCYIQTVQLSPIVTPIDTPYKQLNIHVSCSLQGYCCKKKYVAYARVIVINVYIAFQSYKCYDTKLEYNKTILSVKLCCLVLMYVYVLKDCNADLVFFEN